MPDVMIRKINSLNHQVISVDYFNNSPAGLVIVLPVTTRAKGVRSHVAIAPPEAGLKESSFVKCEDLQSISTERLVSPWGIVKRGNDGGS